MGNYFAFANELSKKAYEHTAMMERMHKDSIERCIQDSIVWTGDIEKNTITAENNELDIFSTFEYDSDAGENFKELELFKGTTTDAIMSNLGFNIVALNFASYKNPGGMFLKGSSAQEECLCHDSYLYNVIGKMYDYYAYNNHNINKGLYTDRAIYTPSVAFIRDSITKYVDVITCAAPNNSLKYRFNSFTAEENSKALKDRIKFLRVLADQSPKLYNRHEVNTIILGAWGCGVFRQDVREVIVGLAREFNNSHFERVIFAIPDDKTYNIALDCFQKGGNNGMA